MNHCKKNNEGEKKELKKIINWYIESCCTQFKFLPIEDFDYDYKGGDCKGEFCCN